MAGAAEDGAKVGIASNRRVSDLTETEIIQIRETIDRDAKIYGDLAKSLRAAGK